MTCHQCTVAQSVAKQMQRHFRIILYYITLYYIIFTIFYIYIYIYIILYCIILYYIILFHIISYYIILYHININILYCITWTITQHTTFQKTNAKGFLDDAGSLFSSEFNVRLDSICWCRSGSRLEFLHSTLTLWFINDLHESEVPEGY